MHISNTYKPQFCKKKKPRSYLETVLVESVLQHMGYPICNITSKMTLFNSLHFAQNL